MGQVSDRQGNAVPKEKVASGREARTTFHWCSLQSVQSERYWNTYACRDCLSILCRWIPRWHGHCGGNSNTIEDGMKRFTYPCIGHCTSFGYGEFHSYCAFYTVLFGGFGVGDRARDEVHDITCAPRNICGDDLGTGVRGFILGCLGSTCTGGGQKRDTCENAQVGNEWCESDHMPKIGNHPPARIRSSAARTEGACTVCPPSKTCRVTPSDVPPSRFHSASVASNLRSS